MWPPRSALWRDRGFVKLFAAVAVSQVGSNVSFLALPLAALYILKASALDVALIRTAEMVPWLVLSLPVGVWIDGVRRRPVMIVADVGRATLIASVPVAFWLGRLTLAQLYVVVIAHGCLTVLFDLSFLSFIPGFVSRERLAEANSKLLGAQSASDVAGPTLGGALVGAVGAAVAVAADAASFAFSGALVAAIRSREPEPRPNVSRRWDELRGGVRFVFTQPFLRTLTVWFSSWNLFSSAFFAVLLVYYVRVLRLDAAAIGLVFSLSGLGPVAGAFVNAKVVDRLGLGPVIAYASPISDVCWLAFPLAPVAHALPFLIVFGFVGGFLGFLVNVNQLTLRQSITPEHMLGRMNSVVRFMYFATLPAGAALGGALASPLGLRRTLLATGVAALLTSLPITFSPIRRLATVDGDARAAGDGGVAAPAE